MAPILDLSRLHPDMTRLRQEAIASLKRNDPRKFADLTLKSVLVAPSPWAYGRFFLWHSYTDSLGETPHIVNESDKKACQKMLRNQKEPALFRALAAFSLAALFGIETDREVNLDYFRQVVEIVQNMPEEDMDRPVIVPADDINSTVGQEAKELVNLAKMNLRNFMDPTGGSRDPAYLEAMAKQREINQTSFRLFGYDPMSSRAWHDVTIRTPPANWPPEMKKRLELGGNACDCCGKTLEQLGVARLNCCAVCKRAYYCGSDCQRKQWKAGHKAACRKPGEIKPLDWMRIRGLQSKPELNERLVTACRVDPAKPDRWIVCFLDGVEEKEISVAIAKLVHIRPAK